MELFYFELVPNTPDKVVVLPPDAAILGNPCRFKHPAPGEHGTLGDTVMDRDETPSSVHIGNHDVFGRIGHNLQTAPEDIYFRMLSHGLQVRAEVIGQVFVVGIEECDELAGGEGQPGIMGAADAAVFLADGDDSWVLRDRFDDAGCVVGAAIVDDDVLPVGGLRLQ